MILVSENDVIEANKFGVTDHVLWDKVSKYPYSDAGGIRDFLALKYLH